RHAERLRERDGGHDLQHLTSIHAHSAPSFICCAMYSLVRMDSMRIVQVGLLSGWLTNWTPSATNRLRTPCARQFASSTERDRSSPMRTKPSSWMIEPPSIRP